MSSKSYSVKESSQILLTLVAAIFVAFYILFAGGCDTKREQVLRETDEPHFNRGQEELKRGNINEALNAFLKVIEKRRESPESHLEVGRIYLNNLEDPEMAIYYLRRYIDAKPNSELTPAVEQMIKTARIRFATNMPLSPFDSNLKYIELEEIVAKLQKENFELKQRLAHYAESIEKFQKAQKTQTTAQLRQAQTVQTSQSQASFAQPATTATPAPASATQANQRVEVRSDVPQTYIVKAGDTLSSISRKIYGTTARWKEIYNANRDRLASPESLKPGQSLILPK